MTISIQSNLLMAAGLAMAVSAAPPAQEKPAYDIAAAARGGSTFKTYCSSCHGKLAKGDGPLAKDLRVQPADLTLLSKKNGGQYPFDMVYQIIDGRQPVKGHGSKDMPAWGDAFQVTDNPEGVKQKITDLTHFLWSIQEQEKE